MKKQPLIKALSHKTAVKMLNSERLKEIIIPIPPLKKQKSIANKLDTLLKLSEELCEELNLRKKQYEYYRDKLLSSEQGNKEEWLTLNNFCKFQKGFNFKASKQRSQGLPILRIKNIQNGKIVTEGLTFFNPSEFKEDLNKYQIKPDDIVIAMSGNTTGKVGINDTNSVFFLNTATGRIDPDETKINRRWLYHFLLSKREDFFNLAECATQPNLYFSQIEKIELLLPPLSDQIRSAEILNKLLNLTEELCEELNLRKKQYEYYRDELLNTQNNLTYLKDICKFKKGFSFEKHKHKSQGEPILKVLNVQKNRISEKGMIYFDKKDYSKDLTEYLAHPGDIVLTIQGASSGKLAFNNLDYSLYLSSTVAKCLFDPKKVNERYLFHFLMSKDYEIHQNVYGADPKRLDLNGLGKIAIPLPSLNRQEKVANLLDKFWELSSDIKMGLPAEILFRNQQYKYYREILINSKDI